jgi:tetratricopeptide (TPR) repeat protein
MPAFHAPSAPPMTSLLLRWRPFRARFVGAAGALILCVLLAPTPAVAQHAEHGGNSGANALPAGTIPLFDNLGTVSRTVVTRSPLAQRYFNQALALTWSFGMPEARQSFEAAIAADSTCALCHWGLAWSLGPYVNGTMDSIGGVRAYSAIQAAQRHAARQRSALPPADRALIEALAVRYTPVPQRAERARLDTAYAAAMRDVARRFPADLDVATLHGEALMVLRPWNYWTRVGEPQPGVEELLAVLEGVLDRNLEHAGACHLYIHAVEASPRAARAAPCADRLRDAIPGASHMRHMPSHIYMRIGRYGDGVRANQLAWQVDQQAAFGGATAIYPTHNLHMLLFAAAYDGQSAVAIQAARDLARLSATSAFYPALVLARFGRWDELLELAEPAAPFQRGVLLSTQGLAHLRKGNADSARGALAGLDSIVDATPETLRFRGHRQRDLLGIGRAILAAELDLSAGRHDAAIATLRAALLLEDELSYDEPEPWILPIRQVLGAVLLDAGRAAEAETAYREELDIHPENGWSLFGLAQALRAQGRAAEADAVQARFDTAWQRADVWIRSSRY